jgi:hypothetical protein
MVFPAGILQFPYFNDSIPYLLLLSALFAHLSHLQFLPFSSFFCHIACM